MRVNRRESAHILREIPRIVEGVSPLTIAREWNTRGIPTVNGGEWRSGTVRNMFLRPRMCGIVVYRGEVVRDEEGKPLRGRWEPIMTDEQHAAVTAAWTAVGEREKSRLGGKGRGYRTNHLLSPFVRCGKCSARMIGGWRVDPRNGERMETYQCPTKGQGGCRSVARVAAPIDAYVTALVIAEQQRINAEKTTEGEPAPWPRAGELAELVDRIEESTRHYEAGHYSAERYFPSLARMEASLAELRREQRTHARAQDTRRRSFANIEQEWTKPSFGIELKQAAIAKSPTAVVIHPAGKGVRFHPDQLQPIFRTD